LRLNNGSFGACPVEVLAECDVKRQAWLQSPDDHWNKELGPGLAAAAADVARRVARCANEELALVDNLTVASTVVADWLVQDAIENAPPHPTKSGRRLAVVLQSCHTYSAVKNAWKAAARRLQRCGVELLVTTVQLPFPVTSEQAVIGAYEVALTKLTAEYGLCTSFLAASSDGRNSSGVAAPPAGASADTAAGTDADGGNAGAAGAGCAPCSSYLRLACLDHISSLPAMVLPVAKLVGLCRDAGFKRVFVDGAHAPGTVSKFAHTRISGYGV
jgi:hypothetical protein